MSIYFALNIMMEHEKVPMESMHLENKNIKANDYCSYQVPQNHIRTTCVRNQNFD